MKIKLLKYLRQDYKIIKTRDNNYHLIKKEILGCGNSKSIYYMHIPFSEFKIALHNYHSMIRRKINSEIIMKHGNQIIP